MLLRLGKPFYTVPNNNFSYIDLDVPNRHFNFSGKMQLTLYFVVVFILLKTTVNGEVEETDESKHGLDVEPSGHEYQPGRLQGQAIIADNRRRGRRTRCKKFNDKGECA